ncbi:hypothetical protein J7E97_22535 [Streptomyces sp. ISL-66]|uniref:hypothetical protein n=1 Tax=Streptomyces sp. ISL-66 TaxID=2819186 RepID=UPI001BE7FD63|nr:hypothetical protein [Streptomyces sp. ISL-66]MBT2470568.1 hypothetical protein [Streptomyces sp. ISL-66]
MHVEDAADCPERGLTRPAEVPAIATRVTWRGTGDLHDVARRYGVVSTLLGAGVDACRIQVFHELEDGGTYWVVTLDDGHTAVLTDDTEEHVGHMEGPWPFKAVFVSPDAVRTKINYSIDNLKAHIVRWYTEGVGPRNDSH